MLEFFEKWTGHTGICILFCGSSLIRFWHLIQQVCAFMFFKNVKIPQSRIINRIATSTLGVLLIHANSDAMRNWLWKDVLKNVTYYNSPFLVLHALGAVGGIYLICTVIDQLRIRLIEVPLFKRLEKR